MIPKRHIALFVVLVLILAGMACSSSTPKEEQAGSQAGEPQSAPASQADPAAATPVAAGVQADPTAQPAPISGLEPGWYGFTNSNVARDVLVYKRVAYTATLGGMTAWNLDSGYRMHYTTQQGMSHVSAYAVTLCDVPELRLVFGTLNGLSLYDPNTGLWEEKSITPEESSINRSKISQLYCDAANKRLLIGYSGLGILDLTDGSLTTFTTKEGLSWNAISDIAVSGKDIWLASGYNGVNKISGDKVTIYNKDNGIPDERARSIAVAKDGSIWVGASIGLMQLKGNQWKLFGADTPARLAEVAEIEIAPDGKLWVATAPIGSGRLCQFDPQSASCLVDFKDPENQPILGLTLDEQGSPIYVTSRGVFVFDGSEVKAFKHEADQLATNFVDSFADDPGGKLWVGTDGGIHLLDPGAPGDPWTTYRKSDTPGLGGSWASDIAADQDGVVWAAIINGNASRYHDGSWTSFEDIYSFNVVTVDSKNRAWFGDDGKGVIVLNSDGSPAFTLTSADGLPSDKVYALLTDAGGAVWIGTDNGLAKYENDVLEVVFDKDDTRLPNKYIRDLALDADGNLLIGAFTGAARWDGSQVETLIDFIKDGFSNARLTKLVASPDGGLWIGSDKGLLYSDTLSGWKMLTTQDGLLTNFISALHVDRYGAIWVGGGGSNFDGGGLLQIVP